MTPSHVLVPLDGSSLADEALSHALETFDCQITVLNVITPVDARMSEGGLLKTTDQRKAAARQRAEELIDSVIESNRITEQSVETVIDTGDPVEVILEYVESAGIDHVIMGGHGAEKSSLSDRLLGTVATGVVNDAPVSVTVVR